MEERWYQAEARVACFKSLKKEGNNPLLVLPTGTGKSIIIANIIKQALQENQGYRVLMLTHVGELVKQNASKIQGALAQDMGVYSSGLKRYDTDNNVIFATVQSVYSVLKSDVNTFGKRDLIIIDECHLLSSDDNSMYRQVLNLFTKLNKNMRVIGLTATPYRLRGGHLLEQDNPIFNTIPYDLSTSFNRLVSQGYLSNLTTVKPKAFLNMEDVTVERGDYKASEVNKMFTTKLIKEACDFAKASALQSNRGHFLFFVTSINTATEVATYLNQIGISSASVHSKNSTKENKDALELFRCGKLKALVNVDQLTTGFDVPFIDMLVILRPTISASLHVQMLGRGTRPASGKKDCLVLDFVGNIERLGAINDPLIPIKPRKGVKGDAPVKACPRCGTYVHASVMHCTNCDHEFEHKQIRYTLSSGTVVACDPQRIDFESLEALQRDIDKRYKLALVGGVEKVKFYLHKNKDKMLSLKVSYFVRTVDCREKTQRFDEYLHFNNFKEVPKKIAKEWWKKNCFTEPPATTQEAFSRVSEFQQPAHILIFDVNKKYPRVYKLKCD